MSVCCNPCHSLKRCKTAGIISEWHDCSACDAFGLLLLKLQGSANWWLSALQKLHDYWELTHQGWWRIKDEFGGARVIESRGIQVTEQQTSDLVTVLPLLLMFFVAWSDGRNESVHFTGKCEKTLSSMYCPMKKKAQPLLIGRFYKSEHEEISFLFCKVIK